MTALSAWNPAEHTADNAYGFLIKTGIYSIYYLRIADGTITLDNKFYSNSALNDLFLCLCGITNIVGQVLHHGTWTTGELWHLLYNIIDIIIFYQ